jgi:hypothetical protein
MHDLIAKLTTMLSLTPEQQFRVSAMIKRHIHAEKASVFSRYHQYSLGAPIFDRTDPENPVHTGKHESGGNDWITNMLKMKAEQHEEWSQMPDNEVITWSVGSFKYVQHRDPCCVCQVDLTGKPYASTGKYVNGVYESKTYCAVHCPEELKRD